MTTNTFDHARAAFLAAGQTLRNERRDFPEWHLGRPHYALWAVDVDLPDVRQAVAGAEAHLDGLLLDGYRRQPHITLALCGFPTAEPQRPDDYSPDQLATQVAALAVAAPAPFTLTVGALASFSSAPFLSVADPAGGIRHLRRALAGDQDEPGGPYTPHVTVGLYAGTWPTARIQPRLDAFAAPALPCRVERISLMHYAAPEIGGALTTLASFDLARRRLDWHHRPTGWPDTD
ncbi:2'-5' RNA ligase family protein [uncultured Zoogloea sp.]|uniref:2'-5' RNA ligase family protein n=1 Tax=uncultured Zoogloea sp. TaxID=160237 RepID=UPI002615CA03|nr:2'-5' RNA ligase family protein [uncultured Zoogloea sp.]